MEKSEIKEKLIGKLAELFADENIDTDLLEYVDLIDDMGMDSLTFVSIIVEIETLFEITVPDDALLMENFRKAENIVELVVTERQKSDLGIKEESHNG